MKRGRDKLARIKAAQRKLDAAYFTLAPVKFDAFLIAGKHAERNNIHKFSDRTVKVMWRGSGGAVEGRRK